MMKARSSNPVQDVKVHEFTQAMETYLNHWFYQKFERVVSILIVSLQFITLLQLIYTYQAIPYYLFIVSLMVAYLATDFINGLVHMFMDNNTHYVSIFGPYVAAFHLHHAKYTYQIRHPIKVYFYESGTKFWLLVYLMTLMIWQFNVHLYTGHQIALVSFGIFSSLAEVSHYWCHHSSNTNKFIQWLQKNRILLSRKHHQAHHRADNIQYAFLNGLTDPILNVISRWCYKGYKQHADKHTAAYTSLR
jgi:hypothetical protein